MLELFQEQIYIGDKEAGLPAGLSQMPVKGLAVQDSFRNYDNQSVALNCYPNRAISRWPSWHY